MELQNSRQARGNRRALTQEINERISKIKPLNDGMREARAIRPLKMAEAHGAIRALVREHDDILSKYGPEEIMVIDIFESYRDALKHARGIDLTREEIAKLCKEFDKHFSNHQVAAGAFISALINTSKDDYFELDFTACNEKNITPSFIGFRNAKTMRINGKVSTPLMLMEKGYAEILSPGVQKIAFRIAGGEVRVCEDAGYGAAQEATGGLVTIMKDAAGPVGKENNGGHIKIFGNVDTGAFEGMKKGMGEVRGNAKYGIAKNMAGGVLKLFGREVELEKIPPGGHASIYYKGKQIYIDGIRLREI